MASAAFAGATCVDLPGHGSQRLAHDERRDPVTWAFDAISDAGDWPRDLIGYSMGGRLAIHFALRFPQRVRRLVLESASPGIEGDADRTRRRRSDTELAARISSDGIEAFSEEWERHPLFAADLERVPDAVGHAREVRLEQDALSLAWALRGLGTGTLPPLWGAMGALAMPVLILVGEMDPKFVEIGRGMAALMPNARIEVVAGAGHRVHLARPDAWIEAVGRFLTSTDSVSAA